MARAKYCFLFNGAQKGLMNDDALNDVISRLREEAVGRH